MTAVVPSPRVSSSYRNWYRATFIGIGSIEAFLASVSMLRGLANVMPEFGVPEPIVNSPHYVDAMFWVMLHMCVIGTICITVGVLVQEPHAQIWLPRVFVFFHFAYAFLDVRASDSSLGTSLYHGQGSLVVPLVSCCLFLAMLHLAVRSFFARDATVNSTALT